MTDLVLLLHSPGVEGSRLVGALVSECAEIVAPSPARVGRQGLFAAGIVIGQRGAEI